MARIKYFNQKTGKWEYADSQYVIGGAVTTTEPAEDDIPKVFFGGALPQTKDDTIMTFRYISKTKDISGYCKTKAQGGSSMDYPKKNQTTKLYKDANCAEKMGVNFKGWGEQNKFCFKANWVDPTHARNIVCANLWSEVVASRSDYSSLPEELRNSPNNGAIDGFPVKLYANGVYQGIYTLNIPKDAWMWNMDENNQNHVLLCGETNRDNTATEDIETATNFRALWSGTDGDDWSVEVGTNSDAVKNSLNALISCVKGTDDETFKATLGNYLDIQSALDYYLFVHVIMGQDSLARNMLLATYDGTKWYCGAYDLDNVWGWATGKVPEDCTETHSLLWERIELLFADELKTRYAELRDTVFSYSNLIDKVERFMDRIGTELYAEDRAVFPDIPSNDNDTVAGFRNVIVQRRPVVDAEVSSWGVGGQYLYRLPEATVFDGSTTYIDTGVKLFDEPKDFSIFIDFEAGTQTGDAYLLGGLYDLLNVLKVKNEGGYPAVYTNNKRNPFYDETSGAWGHKWERIKGIVLVFKAGVFQFGKHLKNHNGTISTLDITAHANNAYEQNAGFLHIGAQRNLDGGASNFWTGTVNDLRIYNRVLTTDEATALLGEISAG